LESQPQCVNLLIAVAFLPVSVLIGVNVVLVYLSVGKKW